MGEKGYEVGFEQLIVNDTVLKLEPVNADGSFEVSEQGRNITIKGNNFEYIFDKSTGNFKNFPMRLQDLLNGICGEHRLTTTEILCVIG